MNARPDVPDTPDRTDAIARALCDCEGPHLNDTTCALAAQASEQILTTDDPAAIAALAATLWERHPDAVLTAGVDAGVLRVGGFSAERGRVTSRLVTDWREVTDA